MEKRKKRFLFRSSKILIARRGERDQDNKVQNTGLQRNEVYRPFIEAEYIYIQDNS
jgi:hypothetical protein